MAQVVGVSAGASPIKSSSPRRPPVTMTNWHHDATLGLVTTAEGKQQLVGHSSVALLVGRCKRANETTESTTSQQTQDDFPSMAGLGSLPHQRVSLPNTARHVSRNHAVFFFLPFAPTKTDDGTSGSWVVKIIGQNGLIIDGKRRRGGQVIRIKSGETEVDFFGTKCCFVGLGRQPQSKKRVVDSDSSAKIVHVTEATPPVVPKKKVVELVTRPRLGTPTQANAATSPFVQRAPLGQLSNNKPNESEHSQDVGSQIDAKLELLTAESCEPIAQPKAQSERRFVGRAEKRPPGAPLSPPTSSPAPFEMQSSSPVHPSSNVFKARGQSQNSEEDDEGDAASSPSPFSPTLDRRAAFRLRRSSAEEASQALAIFRDEQSNDALGSSAGVEKVGNVEADRREAENALGSDSEQSSEEEEEEAENMTPSPSPKKKIKKSTSTLGSGLKIKLKRVQFAARHATSRSSSRASTPRSRTPSQQPPLEATEKTANASAATSTSASTQLAPLQAHVRRLVGTLAQTYDLESLLAGAIVFHRTATISATEAVRSVLSSNPGLLRGEVGTENRDHEHLKALSPGSALKGWHLSSESDWQTVLTGDESSRTSSLPLPPTKDERDRVLELYQRRAWRERLEAVLQTRDCFGIIQRAGKDASGNPLECWYYYDRDHDEDRERAKNLGAFAKPIRGALKTHKPIFWKKSAYGHEGPVETGSTGALSQAEQLQQQQPKVPLFEPVYAYGATESQWGSSGNVLDGFVSASASGVKREWTGEEGKTVAAKPSRPTPIPIVTSTSTSGDQVGGNAIANTTVWDETQMQEDEKTWDRFGDLDFTSSSKGKSSKRRKR